MNDNWDSNKFTTIVDLQEKINNELIDQLGFNENDHVLDAGCGVGNLTFKVARIVKAGRVVGIDSSPSMIKKCNETLKTENISNVEFYVKSITDIDLTNEFNIVYSNSVFHWIKNPGKAMDLLFRSLKTAGNMGIQFPVLNSKHPMIAICERVITRLKLENEFRNWDFPWYAPTADEFKTLVSGYDFEEIKVYKKNIEFNFIDSSKLYNSFDSAGLNMYTSTLSPEKAIRFKQEVKKEIEDMGQLTTSFDRLYAFGFKKLT